MKTIKTIFVTGTKWIFLSAMFVGILIICYGAFAQARRAGTQDPKNDATGVSAVQTTDCDERALQRANDPEFIEASYGTDSGSVPSEAFAKAMAAARALPPSPLLQKRPSSLAPQIASTWTLAVPPPLANDWGGGASARIDAIAVPADATNPNGDVVYVGGAAGLARSVNGGLNWSYLSDALASQSIRSIAVDPIAPNIIYAGTGDGAGNNPIFGVGIYRSTDSGANWALIGPPQSNGKTICTIAIDPETAGSQTSTTLYASVSGGAGGGWTAWKSTNSGMDWTGPIRSATGSVSNFYGIAIKGDPGVPQPSPELYVAAPNGLWKSTNRGDNWVNIHPRGTPPVPGTQAHLAYINSTSTLYLGFYDPANGGVIVDKYSNGTWTETPTKPGLTGISCFGVNPNHSEQIFVGTGGDLHYSLDSGSNWLTTAPPPPCDPNCVHVDNRSFAFSRRNSQRNYLGTDAGIYRTDYDGSGRVTWVNYNQNLAGCLMGSISISSDDHIVMGNQDNGTQLGCPTCNPPWTMLCGGDGGGKPQIDPDDSNKLYFPNIGGGRVCETTACYPNGNVTRWVNGLKTDITPRVAPNSACGELRAGFPALFMSPLSSARVTVGFQNVYRSTDSGNAGSWTRVGGRDCSVDPNDCGIDRPNGIITGLYESPSNTNVIYAITANTGDTSGRKMFVTTDAGGTWFNQTGPLTNIRNVTADPSDSNIAYAACDLTVYKTTNRGASWTSLSTPPGNLPQNAVYRDVAIDLRDHTHIFVASQAGGVLASTDSGGSWASMNTDIPMGMRVLSLSFNKTSRQLAAATYGRGAYILDLDDVPPTVSITSPIKGQIVSGPVTVSATASDNHLVAGVQFKLDGSNLGNEERYLPYSISWDTTTTTNGLHTLTAVARDPAGNTRTSVSVQVTVSN